MATKVNMDRHVREGWTVGAFIRELAPQVEMIMSGQSWREPFRNKQEFQKQTGTGGLVQGQPTLLQEKDS